MENSTTSMEYCTIFFKQHPAEQPRTFHLRRAYHAASFIIDKNKNI